MVTRYHVKKNRGEIEPIPEVEDDLSRPTTNGTSLRIYHAIHDTLSRIGDDFGFNTSRTHDASISDPNQLTRSVDEGRRINSNANLNTGVKMGHLNTRGPVKETDDRLQRGPGDVSSSATGKRLNRNHNQKMISRVEDEDKSRNTLSHGLLLGRHQSFER